MIRIIEGNDNLLSHFQVFLRDGGYITYWDWREREKKRKIEYKQGKLSFIENGKRYIIGEDIPYEDVAFYIEGETRRIRPNSISELEDIIKQKAKEGFT